MIYCFDTSAINRLLDDPEREPIVASILAVGSFRITAYNILEAAKTANSERRDRLIHLMRRLSNGKRPLEQPNKILLEHAAAYAKRAPSVEVTTDDTLDGLWTALNQPELLEEAERKVAADWAAQSEDKFSRIVFGDREQFQHSFQGAPGERPRTSSATIRAYLSKKEECYSLIGDVYQRRTQKSLTRSEYEGLMLESAWPLYFVAYAYAIHQRSVKEHHFQDWRNAGAIDLGQAVYLTLCDRFVTDDKAQCRALRLLNVFNRGKCTVTRYNTFRKRLLIFA